MNETTPTTYENSYVAFLDILGFKSIVLGRSHDHLQTLYLETISGNVQHALANGKYALANDGETEWIGPDLTKATVNSILVSDSILIWTNECSAASFQHLVAAVRSLLAFSMMSRLPLRGAIATGPLTMAFDQWPSPTHCFQHTLFGRAIVEAVEAEKAQQWAGCMITETAFQSYQNSEPGENSLLKRKVILPYPVPLKGNQETMHHVIDWVNHPQVGINTQTLASAFAPVFPDDDEFEQHIRPKFENTLKFVRHVKPSADEPLVTKQFVF